MSVGMGLFNLIPIPPLDGSKGTGDVLPNSAYGQLMRYERYGILVLLALSWLGLGGNFLGDAIYGVYEALFHTFCLRCPDFGKSCIQTGKGGPLPV